MEKKILIAILFICSSLFAIETKVVDNHTYINLFELDKELKLSGKWDPLKGVYKFEYPENQILSLAENHNEIFINGNFISITKSVLSIGNEWWVPHELLNILDSIGENNIRLDKKKLILSSKSDLRGIQFDPRSNGTLVTLEVSENVKFEKWYHYPHYIIRFNNFDPGDTKIDTTFTSGQIRNVKTFKESKSYQVTFEVNHLVGDVELIEKSEEGKISLLFRKPEKTTQAKPVKDVVSQKKIKKIIIDPGHGGKDHGAIGKITNEKTIVLSVAKALKKDLESEGYDVVLTRDKDEFKTLKERPEIASKKGGDLFISLHANAIDGDKKRKEEVKGFKVYILREAVSNEDKAMARRENQFVDHETESHVKKELSPVDWIMLEHQLNLYTKESELFANEIVNTFEKNEKNIRKHGTGAGQAGFYVLVGAFMPAVLFEIGFISNLEDEKYMNTSKGAAQTAKLMTEAVKSFEKTLNGK